MNPLDLPAFAEGLNPRVVEDNIAVGESPAELVNDTTLVDESNSTDEQILFDYMADGSVDTDMLGMATVVVVNSPAAQQPLERFGDVDRIADYVEYAIAMHVNPPTINFGAHVTPVEGDNPMEVD